MTEIDFDPIKDEIKRLNGKRTMVTNVDAIGVYDGPEGAYIGCIQNGYVVKLIEEHDEWAKVVWGDYLDKIGYVRKKNLIDVKKKSKSPALLNGTRIMI